MDDLAPDSFVTVREMSAALHVSEPAGYRLVDRGDVVSIKVGARILIPASSILRYISDHFRSSAAPDATADVA